MSLSDRTIRDAKPKSSVYRLRDGNVVCRGFGVTIAPTGAKTFFLSYTSPEDGKRKQIALGQFPKVTLAAARRKAMEVRAKVDEGSDPAVEKKLGISARIAKREQGTLGDLLSLYADNLEADGKRTAREVRRITKKDISATLLGRPAHLITRDDILDILTPIARRGAPIHSDNVRAYLRAAFELGLNAESMTRWRGRAKTFGIAFNPVVSVPKTVSRKPRGQRALSPAEIAVLWHTDLLTPAMHLALKLILSTGQRVEEVLGASWQEFDFENMVWLIPGERRKTRNMSSEPHAVPLTDLHVDILNHIRTETNDKQLLFPARENQAVGSSRRKGGPTPRRYDSLNHSVRRYVEASGMTTFSPRDLRRTFKTVAGSFGLPLEIRNRLQGHGMTDVGSVYYDRHDYLAEKRTAMEKWTRELSDLLIRKGK